MGSLFNPIDNTVGWIGSGATLFSKLDKYDRPTGGFWNAGFCSSALLALSTERAEMQDTMYGTGGIAKSKVIKTNGEVTLTLKSFEPKNMAVALYSEIVRDAATAKTITREVSLGTSIVLDGIASEITSVKSADGIKTYEAGVHFIASSGSIFFYDEQPEADGVEDGEEVEVKYMSAAVDRIEGFINKSVDLMIVFEGFNVDTDNDVKVTWYKVSLDPIAQRQLISTEYSDIELKGKLQISKAVTGVGLSKMFKEEHRVPPTV